MNRDKIGTQTCINVLKGMLIYIACLCPNLVSVHFYAIPIYTSNFLNFLFTCIMMHNLLDTLSIVCSYLLTSPHVAMGYCGHAR